MVELQSIYFRYINIKWLQRSGEATPRRTPSTGCLSSRHRNSITGSTSTTVRSAGSGLKAGWQWECIRSSYVLGVQQPTKGHKLVVFRNASTNAGGKLAPRSLRRGEAKPTPSPAQAVYLSGPNPLEAQFCH